MAKKCLLICSLSLLLTASFFQSGCYRARLKTLNVAHRGASGTAPENTMAAFRKAVEFGADCAELDVQLSKDGVVYLLHDSTLDRTTDGTGAIRNYTSAELEKLDAGSHFSAEFAGEPLPTLDEVIRFARGKIKLDIELKISGLEPGIVQKVVDIVRSNHFASECFITSFDRATVEEAKRIAPEIKAGFIINKLWNDEEFKGEWDYVVAKYSLIDQAFLDKAQKANKKIYIYTVNNEEEMKKLAGLGLAGIITNYPERLKRVISELEKAK